MIAHRAASQNGFAMMEALCAVFLTFLASLGIAMSMRTSMYVEKKAQIHMAAATIAASKMESLAAIDPSTLTAANNETTDPVTYPGTSVTFKRVTTVTVNPDNSRTFKVTVTSNRKAIPTTVTFETTFAVWQ